MTDEVKRVIGEARREREAWARRLGILGCLHSEAALMRAAARADAEGRHGDAFDIREEAEQAAHGG